MIIECETIHMATKLVEVLMDDQIYFDKEGKKYIGIYETQGFITGEPSFCVCINENNQEK